MQKGKGFTLVELIIAISILSMLMFTGSYVYGTLFSRWDKELGEFSVHFDEMRSIVLIQDLLSGVMPFVVSDFDNGKQVPTLFFVGKEDSLLAVSRNGIVNQTHPEIFRLTVVKNESGKFDLVYQSASTKDVLLLNTTQSITFNHSFTLKSNLDSIAFSYFGWTDLTAKAESTYEGSSATQQWFSNYSGLENRLNPANIELLMSKEDKNIRMNLVLDFDAETLLEYYLNDVTE